MHNTPHSEKTKKRISEIKKKQFAENPESHPWYGKIRSKETKDKISKAKKGCIPWNKGISMSEESRLKMSISSTGFKHSEETKKKIGIISKGKKHTEKTKKKMSDNRKGMVFSKEHRLNIAKSKTGKNNHNYGTHLSDGLKQKIRLGNIKHLIDTKGVIQPNYNSEACKYFDQLNKKFKLNGQHAKNGGEFLIKELGYWVDYYEGNLNLIIEWDEKRHYDIDGNLKRKDILRQKQIENHLDCNLLRIKECINMEAQFMNIENYIKNIGKL